MAYRYGRKVWQVEGGVIYTPLGSAAVAQGDYSPPSPQTLMSLVKKTTVPLTLVP